MIKETNEEWKKRLEAEMQKAPANMSAINIGSGTAIKEAMPMTETEYIDSVFGMLLDDLIHACTLGRTDEAKILRERIMGHVRAVAYGPFAQDPEMTLAPLGGPNGQRAW